MIKKILLTKYSVDCNAGMPDCIALWLCAAVRFALLCLSYSSLLSSLVDAQHNSFIYVCFLYQVMDVSLHWKVP